MKITLTIACLALGVYLAVGSEPPCPDTLPIVRVVGDEKDLWLPEVIRNDGTADGCLSRMTADERHERRFRQTYGVGPHDGDVGR